MKFEIQQGRHTIIDTSETPHIVYIAPAGLGHDYIEEGVVDPDAPAYAHAQPQPHHQQGGFGDAPPPWFTQWSEGVTQQFQGIGDRFSTIDQWRGGVDTSLAEITTMMRRVDVRGSEHYAMDRQHVHDQEYYRHVEYERYRQRDPMDYEYTPAAPLHYRAGPSYEPPPPTEFQHYQAPPQTEHTGVFGSIYEGLFGHPPSYPGSSYQPPPQ